MQLDLDVAGRQVVIFGRYPAARRVVRRYAAGGARVTAVMDGALPLSRGRDPRPYASCRLPDPTTRPACSA